MGSKTAQGNGNSAINGVNSDIIVGPDLLKDSNQKQIISRS